MRKSYVRLRCNLIPQVSVSLLDDTLTIGTSGDRIPYWLPSEGAAEAAAAAAAAAEVAASRALLAAEAEAVGGCC